MINAIITGATGMVGEGVLHLCLNHAEVKSVLVVGRRTCGIKHQKLTEIVLENLFDLSAIQDRLQGYNACYFCLGVSSVGMSESEYTHITYDLTLCFAETLAQLNPQMTFCYVSGTGTDSTEQGGLMWARVKGKTENDLAKLPFKAEFNFRPGYIKPIKSLKNTKAFAKPLAPIYPILKFLFPNGAVKLEELSAAMISVTLDGFDKNILESRDISIIGRI